MNIKNKRVLRHRELERLYLTHPLKLDISKVPIKLSDRIVYCSIGKNN